MARWVIDASHGGKDFGGRSTKGLNEKDITLGIASVIQKELESRNEVVLMTRTEDKYIEESERAIMANNWLADYFISIHLNFSSDILASGTEIFLFNDDGISEDLGEFIKSSLVAGLGTNDLGKNYEETPVLMETNMPSIVIECEYLSNPEFENNLDIVMIGKLISRGIFRFLGDSDDEDINNEEKDSGWLVCVGYYSDYYKAERALGELKGKGFDNAYIIREK